MSSPSTPKLHSNILSATPISAARARSREPCPHPGKYHLSSDGAAIILPHPQASTCFAREQGYLIAKIEPSYLALGPAMVAGLNAAPEAVNDPRYAK